VSWKGGLATVNVGEATGLVKCFAGTGQGAAPRSLGAIRRTGGAMAKVRTRGGVLMGPKRAI